MSKYSGKSSPIELGKLHIYGDLLKLYNLPAQGTIKEVGKLYRELHALEYRLLTLYASYILAHEGFYIELWTSKDFVNDYGQAVYTTKYNEEDWIKEWDLFEPLEEERLLFVWDVNYKNEQNERMKLVFVTTFWEEIAGERRFDEVEVLQREFDESCSNYVLVHPLLVRQKKKSFMNVKEKMKQFAGQDLILSTGEFLAKFIPDRKKRHIIEENWNSLRRRIVRDLRKKWPILVFATNEQQLKDIEEMIRRSRTKYEARYFEDAIKDAGVACESLLQILYSIYISKTAVEELHFYDLLCALKEVLSDEFGSNIYQDLDLIRIWRNNVVHPRREKPDGTITLQVIAKAEVFNEIFRKKIFQEK